MHIEHEIKLDFKDVLLRPKRSRLKTRSEVNLLRDFKFCHSSQKWQGIPIISANMDHTGTFSMARKLSENNMITALHKFHDVKQWQEFKYNDSSHLNKVAVSIGTRTHEFEQLHEILKECHEIPFICLDVANGYSEHFLDTLKNVRENHPDKIIIAGNVVTGEMTEQLILSGADIVKVGIGPGSVCTTRKKTGVGYPQLSAVIECADAAHGIGGHICSDGGCVNPGDIAKAFGAGADFVMLGGMLSGHDECSGDIIENANGSFKRFYGMSSAEAMNKYHQSVADYRASEGKSVNVPYRGPVNESIKDILGGLRSACTYVGAKHLKELPKCTTFIRVTQQINNSMSNLETF